MQNEVLNSERLSSTFPMAISGSCLDGNSANWKEVLEHLDELVSSIESRWHQSRTCLDFVDLFSIMTCLSHGMGMEHDGESFRAFVKEYFMTGDSAIDERMPDALWGMGRCALCHSLSVGERDRGAGRMGLTHADNTDWYSNQVDQYELVFFAPQLARKLHAVIAELKNLPESHEFIKNFRRHIARNPIVYNAAILPCRTN